MEPSQNENVMIIDSENEIGVKNGIWKMKIWMVASRQNKI
jgi:hypothetical protein